MLLDLQADLAGSTAADRIALNNVLNTWKRVCRDVGDGPAESRFKNYPSRMPKDWKPVDYREPSPPPPVGPGMAIMEKLTGQPDPVRKPPSEDRKREIEERIVAARAYFKEHSRYS